MKESSATNIEISWAVRGSYSIAASAASATSERSRLPLPARYGGEEFALLLPDTDAAGAAEVANRCLRRIAKTPIDAGEGPSLTVTASMGVAAFPDASVARIEDLLRRADEALYRAKEEGRNRVVVAEPMKRASTEQSGPVAIGVPPSVSGRSR